MATTIIDRLADHLDPQSVSNVLYETMLDWHQVSMRLGRAQGEELARLVGRRLSMERILGRFFGVSQTQMRKMLKEHFSQVNGSGS